ncbi:YwiC-like family protein [Litchfieldia salsa]|uniref:YwiC-like protein n=1 Tax=Litchfieldia salsa TaxID=930152 RepID=A0A1H0S837_9BACI|nr:YwiC-like family protein [Litchfieldia salsa]SDP37805.1 YwiC-like protein [Litchfieldia salsa]
MKLLLPKQHGAWAMLFIPFLFGVFLGQPSWIHVPLVVGWFFLYLATYPLLMLLKNKQRELYQKWTVIYTIPVVISLSFVIIYNPMFVYFGLLMLPFFLVNIYFAKTKNERALLNDFSAVIVFSIGGIASYYAGTGTLDQRAYMIFVLSTLFFIGSTFFIKSMIREKRNPVFKWVSWGFHVCVMIGLILVSHPLLLIAYTPSFIRAFYLYGKNLSIMRLGIYEIINSVLFFICIILLIN